VNEQEERRRLLVLAPFPPRLDAAHGGGRSLAQLIEIHAQRSRVVLLALRRPEDEGVDDAVRDACELVREVNHVPIGHSFSVARREHARLAALARGRPLWAVSILSRAYGDALQQLCGEWQPNVVQAEFGVMGTYLRLVPRPARRVLVDHDPGVRRAGTWIARQSWRMFASDTAATADAIVAFSPEDVCVLRSLAPADVPVVQIPLAWRISRHPLDAVGAEPPTVLFVGNYRHAPNVDAAKRLARILPELKRRSPSVSLAIVGEHAPGGLAETGAVVVGRVPDVEPWLAAAAIVAAPLHSGGGTRVKVLEALRAGKAVVGTALAFEGLDVVDGRDVVIANDDTALTDALERLIADPERRRSLGAAAHAWAERLPTRTDIATAYEALYRRLENA
jgi:glycosyltransferase involved in cell wall biosynthesis